MSALVKMLIEIKEGQANTLSRLGMNQFESMFVFGNELGERIHSNMVRKCLDRITKRMDLGFRVTPHCLRHTFATCGIERGIDLKVMQELLGHSSFKITADTYLHITPSKKAESITKMADIFDY